MRSINDEEVQDLQVFTKGRVRLPEGKVFKLNNLENAVKLFFA